LYISAYKIQVDAPRINIQNEQCQVVTDTGLNYIKIPRSLWVDFLQEAGYNKFQIIEIPIDYSDIISNAKKFKQQGIEDRFKKAAQQLEIVMKKMDEGNWADAVGECRLVIDNFRKGTVKDDDGGEISPLKIIEKILKRSGFPSENVEGFKQMIERIYAYSSMKYHIKVNGEDEEIIISMGREDALFVVSNTVTILNLLTRKYISIKK
jgi:asparagine N-glycosylation enzyme membrane subunit Stt3